VRLYVAAAVFAATCALSSRVPLSPGTTAPGPGRYAALGQARTYLGLAPAPGTVACLVCAPPLGKLGVALPPVRDGSERPSS